MTVQITVKGRPLALSLEVPVGKTTLDAMIPAMDQLAYQVIGDAIAHSSERVSCAKGCDTCCRQLVPIAPAEARTLQKLVEEMPAMLKGEILSRFEQNIGELRESGVYGELMDRRFWEKGVAREVGLRYLGLNLRCPFLDKAGACGIYANRPIACREYLVTSDPEYCRNPDGKTIKPVMIPASPIWAKLSRMEQDKGEKLNWIPLIFCLIEASTPTGEELEAQGWIARMF